MLLVGQDIRPDHGIRVNLVPVIGDKGPGTISAVHGDTVTVVWDSGDTDEHVPVGERGQFHLCPKDYLENVSLLSSRGIDASYSSASGGWKQIYSNGASNYSSTTPTFATSPRAYVFDRHLNFSTANANANVDMGYDDDMRQSIRAQQSPLRLEQNPAGVSAKSPRVMQTRVAEFAKPPVRERPRQPAQSVGLRRVDLSLGIWDQLISVEIPRQNREVANTGGHSSGPRPATKGSSTIGLSVYGTHVDYVVPGGPAHLSQMLEKGDEICSVDGMAVDMSNVVGCLQGADFVGSTVRLKVLKHVTEQEVDVTLVRVPKSSMENLVRTFQIITLLKQNGHTNEAYEQRTYTQDHQLTIDLVDKLVLLISDVQIEKHTSEVHLKTQFAQLYEDLRSHLRQAYDDIDVLRALELSNGEYKEQVEHLKSELDALKREENDPPILDKGLCAVAQRTAPPPPSMQLQGELDAKRAELAKELEEGMQRDFEIRRLNAQTELLLKELETAKRTITTKDKELQQRTIEDMEIATKMQTLQQLLQDATTESTQYKEASLRFQHQMEVVSNNEVEKMKKEVSLMESQLMAKIEALDQQVGEHETVVKKGDMHIAELQQMLQQREKNVIAGQNELAQLQQALVEANIKVQQLQMHVGHRAGTKCNRPVLLQD